MEIKVNRSEFIKGLKTVEKAIEENKIKPIITCVYLETCEDALYFYGTNLELTIITKIPAEIKKAGKIVFQRQIVEEYLKELSDEWVNLVATENSLLLLTEESSTEFALFPVVEYPKSYLDKSLENEYESFHIGGQDLIEAFDKTKFSAAQDKDDSRINCVRMESSMSGVNFVATDSYRMAYLRKEIETSLDFAVSLPLKTVDAFTKLYRNLEEVAVLVQIGKKNMKFTIENTVIVSRLIETPFPDYKGILSNLKYSNQFHISSGEFLNMLKRVIIFVRNNQESKYGATFNIGRDKLVITGAGDIAKISEDCNIEFSGDEVNLSLNTKYVKEYIENIESSSSIKVEFTNSESSVKISDSKNENYIYIVMPVTMRSGR